MGAHSLCRQQCLGEAWECLPQLQSLCPLFRVSLAVCSAGATMAELQLIAPCHQSILLVAVGTTCHPSCPLGLLTAQGASREGVGRDWVRQGTASALAWLGWTG